MRYRITRLILTGLTILVVLFVFLAFLRVGIGFWLYSKIDTWATVRLGLDYYAAQLVTTIIVAVVAILLPSFAWYSLLGKQKASGTAAMIGGQALVFLLVYTVGQDVYFDRSTGKPLRYYTDTPDGRQFSFTPGFDPKYGIEFKPYTKEIANITTTVPQSSSKGIPNKKSSISGEEVSKPSSTIQVQQRQAAVQPTVYQPPVQHPVLTQQQLKEAAAKNECDQSEGRYYQILVTNGSPRLQQIHSMPSKTERERQLVNFLRDMRESREVWHQERSRCQQIPGWQPTKLVGDAENSVLRADCYRRSNNFKMWFENMTSMNEAAKNRYLTSNGELPYTSFVSAWKEVDGQCTQYVPGWETPDSTRIAYEQQTNTTR